MSPPSSQSLVAEPQSAIKLLTSVPLALNMLRYNRVTFAKVDEFKEKLPFAGPSDAPVPVLSVESNVYLIP